MTSAIRPISEKCVKEEGIFNDYDSGEECCDSENLYFNRE